MTITINGTTGLTLPTSSGIVSAPSGTALQLQSNGTTNATLDASGNLGVGTTSPSGRLHVRGSTATAYFQCDDTGQVQLNFGGTTTPAKGGIYYSDNSDVMWFRTGSTERARIDSSGNLLVGKTSTGLATGVQLESTGGSSFVRSASTNSDLNLYVYSTGAGAARFYVGMGGTVYATSTSISAISDATLKENVRDLETGLSEVMALKPRRFDWKNGDAQNVAGFVAQEVEQVLPELVTDYVYSKDEEGNDILKKSLKMGDILPTLVKAIQELKADLDATKAELAALKGAA